MANFNLTINSRFRPFTFDELAKPYLMYGQEFKSLQDAMGGLGAEADKWQNRLDPELDSKAYKLYSKYSADLTDRASKLMENGLTPVSRKDLLDMKRRYSSEITPIEEAYTKRLKDIERQQKVADASGGRTIFSRNASSISLNDYMEGNVDYKQANLDAIMKEAAAGATGISSRYWNTTEGRRFGNDYYSLTKTQGVNPTDAISILQGRYGNSQQFQDFKDFITKGLDKYQGFGDQQQLINDAFMQGINEGIVYKQDEDLKENWRAKLNAEAAKELSVARQKAAMAKEDSPTDAGYALYTPVDPQVKVNAEGKAQRDADKKFILAWRADKSGNFMKEEKNQGGVNPLLGVTAPAKGARSRSNRTIWTEMVKRYGTDSPEKILQQIKKENSKMAVVGQRYMANVTDNDELGEFVKNNMVHSFGKDLGVSTRKLDESGKPTTKYVNQAEINKNITKNIRLTYDRGLQSFILSGEDKDGNMSHYSIDPQYVNSQMSDGKGLDIQQYIDAIKEFDDKEDYVSGNMVMQEMFGGAIISPSRARIQAQAKTSDKNYPDEIGNFVMQR